MAKKERPLVKVPKGRIGRLVFAGGQTAAALAAVRAVKDARAKGDKLAMLHGVLTVAVVAVTAVVALRTVREQSAAQSAVDGELVEPKALTSGSK
jgi:ribosomal protein L10